MTDSRQGAFIEPGLIQVFRLLIGIRLFTTFLVLCGWLANAEQRLSTFPFFSLAETLFLMGYLSWPLARRSLGKVYLPFAIVVATIGPILGFTSTLAVRLASNAPNLTNDGFIIIFALLIPLLIVSWQYSFRSVLVFSFGSVGLIAAYIGVINRLTGNSALQDVFGMLALMCLLYIVLGYIVSRLMKAQRKQRMELSEANLQLAHHAATLQQLTISHERNRMAREMHDTLAHSLSALAVQLEAVKSLWHDDPAEAQAILEQSLLTTRSGLTETRRTINDLRASPLEDLGLGLALTQLAEVTAQRGGWKLALDIPQEIVGLSPVIEQGIFRIIGEALTNIEHHAGASTVSLSLQEQGGTIRVTVIDDGCGFDMQQQTPQGHFGLKGMRERASVMGGNLTVESAPGEGTCIQLEVERA